MNMHVSFVREADSSFSRARNPQITQKVGKLKAHIMAAKLKWSFETWTGSKGE